jgi:predicted transcriptional regulator
VPNRSWLTSLKESEGIDRLFYELASESRLSILRALQTKNYKMQELARKLDLTDTETFRQLQRLSEAQLTSKQPDGTYTVTEYGKLILKFSHSFEFAFKFKQCLLTRNVWRIPDEFIERLGELSNATLSINAIEMVNNAEQLILGTEEYLWMIGERPLSFLGAKVAEMLQKGITVRFMFDESCRKFYENIPDVRGVIEKRVIPVIPAILIINEKFAGINILSIDGRADNAIFYGNDSAILKWANDLFILYWEQAKHIYPT